MCIKLVIWEKSILWSTVRKSSNYPSIKYPNITSGRLVSSYQLNAHFLYSITIYMLHYNPQHVSSRTLLILRGDNCIITASGIVTLCKRPYGMPVESGLQSALNRHTGLYYDERSEKHQITSRNSIYLPQILTRHSYRHDHAFINDNVCLIWCIILAHLKEKRHVFDTWLFSRKRN